jgi:short-subunit dehydrogenase
MKVAITGHTNGIGLGLYNYFIARGDEVIGFSRTNGYTMPEANDTILEQIVDCDIFINNSEPIESQTFFLRELWPLWWDKEKTIIIIGSVLAKIVSKHEEFYQAQLQKKILDLETRRLAFNMKLGRKLIITAIHPSFVKTNLHTEFGIPDAPDEVTLSVQEVVDVVDMTLKSPVVIEEVVFRKR